MEKKEERLNRFRTPLGSRFVPIFELNEKDEVVDSGKRHDLYAEIQSYRESVELDKIVARSLISGETFLPPKEAFGDATILPHDPLEAMNLSKQAQFFMNSLSSEDKELLESKGFDAFIAEKIAANLKSKTAEDPQGGMDE